MEIPYSYGKVELRGNASQLISLADTGVSRISWEPEDKRAMDVEVRLSFHQIPDIPLDALIFGAPFIRWAMRIGHGQSVVEHPLPSFPLQPGTRTAFGSDIPRGLWPMMPARGLLMRVNTREFSLLVQNTGYFGSGYITKDLYGDYLEEMGFPTLASFPPVVMAVSFQPVDGLEISVAPRYACVDPFPDNGGSQWGNYVQFPASANEWRVYDAAGKPFASDPPTASARQITCLDPVGKTVTQLLPEELAEWQPIPLGAWALQRLYDSTDTIGFNVEFR